MDSFQIFGVQFALSLLVYALIARWYVVPRLNSLPLERALLPLLLLHAMRHLGLTLLVPAVVDPNLPRAFAAQVGYGDLGAGLLALLAIFSLRAGWPGAVALVWIFNVWGLLDLLNAFSQGTRIGVTGFQLGAGWLIPTFVVPALAVTHYMMFRMLLQPRGRPRTA